MRGAAYLRSTEEWGQTVIPRNVRVVLIVLAWSLSLAGGVSYAQGPGPIGRGLAREVSRQPFPEPLGEGSSGNGLRRLNQFRGRMIYISSWQFSERLARCVGATATELTVTIGGIEQRLPRRDIRRVSIQGDSLANGTLLGAAVGVLGGLAQGGAGTAAGGAAVYGGIGAWIDSRRVGRTVIYGGR